VPAATPVLLLWTADAKVVRSLEALAVEHGLTVHRSTAGALTDEPAVAVLDLDSPGALDALTALRERWPEALVAGHLGLPDRERWLAAERAGCDVVANRGALTVALRKRLAAGSVSRGRRVPLFASDDAAGRLGCVLREPEGTVAEPFAVYHLGKEFHACADRCPHAGATLSEGELENGVVTCPRHGSQFDVRTGQRLRGPADTDVATFPLIEDRGQVYLLVPEAPVRGPR
jgi:nitrite reductase/ring-hydroxylating ferredoxin subunit